MRFAFHFGVIVVCVAPALAQEAARPLTPAEALSKIDQNVTVQMAVKSTGGNTARFLNSEVDFRSEKNFAVFIPNIALDAFKRAGVEDPAKYYNGKSIMVTGTVALSQSRPQIRVENPGQIKVVNSPATPVPIIKSPSK